jgi:transposase
MRGFSRRWHKLFEQRGIEGLTSIDMGGSTSFFTTTQEDALKAFVGATLPRSTRQVSAVIEREFGLVYESRSELIALLHRLGSNITSRMSLPRKLDVAKQEDFIESYDRFLNSLGNDETCCSWMRYIRPTRRGLSPAGRPDREACN